MYLRHTNKALNKNTIAGIINKTLSWILDLVHSISAIAKTIIPPARKKPKTYQFFLFIVLMYGFTIKQVTIPGSAQALYGSRSKSPFFTIFPNWSKHPLRPKLLKPRFNVHQIRCIHFAPFTPHFS